MSPGADQLVLALWLATQVEHDRLGLLGGADGEGAQRSAGLALGVRIPVVREGRFLPVEPPGRERPANLVDGPRKRGEFLVDGVHEVAQPGIDRDLPSRALLAEQRGPGIERDRQDLHPQRPVRRGRLPPPPLAQQLQIPPRLEWAS